MHGEYPRSDPLPTWALDSWQGRHSRSFWRGLGLLHMHLPDNAQPLSNCYEWKDRWWRRLLLDLAVPGTGLGCWSGALLLHGQLHRSSHVLHGLCRGLGDSTTRVPDRRDRRLEQRSSDGLLDPSLRSSHHLWWNQVCLTLGNGFPHGGVVCDPLHVRGLLDGPKRDAACDLRSRPGHCGWFNGSEDALLDRPVWDFLLGQLGFCVGCPSGCFSQGHHSVQLREHDGSLLPICDWHHGWRESVGGPHGPHERHSQGDSFRPALHILYLPFLHFCFRERGSSRDPFERQVLRSNLGFPLQGDCHLRRHGIQLGRGLELARVRYQASQRHRR
mmetsp:Transcript_21268/g.50602  ORF Transcript_21268/g.50602 Transcript_21268/m.50602 type:complete len:330 (-) Transcript_21268:2257-3246(-)